MYVTQHTTGGHDAQSHEGVASDQFVVVVDEPAERLQRSKSQQRNLILISWQQRETMNNKNQQTNFKQEGNWPLQSND